MAPVPITDIVNMYNQISVNGTVAQVFKFFFITALFLFYCPHTLQFAFVLMLIDAYHRVLAITEGEVLILELPVKAF